MSRRKYPDGKVEYICKYCGKTFLGNYNRKVCFGCRSANVRKRTLLKRLNNKEVL